MIFRQLFDSPTSTYSYLLADPVTREGVLIDSVFEQYSRDLALVRELNIKLKLILDTHVHADHVTGAWLMQQAVGSEIALSANSGAQNMDRALEDGDMLNLGGLEIEVRTTPGHTSGCLSYYLPKEKMIFTGDALLIRGAGRTDFQEGDAAQLFKSVREKILSLEDEVVIYPGHDYSGRTSTTVAEEKLHNPRLGQSVREQDFVGYMDNLKLPHPNRLEIAVPANLQLGKPEQPLDAEGALSWAPVIRTYAGVLQIEPEWVRDHLDDLLILDVREQGEIDASPMKALEGAQAAPLSTLRETAASFPTDKPIVTICPAGARSAMAATILEQAGIERVANLRGGILEWHSQGYSSKG
jgi:glyoxylase-like metal-dependent hydrolase (beta-lactamase superfamily II)/rhodanese-related sulfurtransferase